MMEIGKPSALANIPLPITQHGRTYYSQVYGLSGGLKRKRQELCAAIDGDSINTFEIRQGRILSSCPIPPDAVLACAPCSIYSKKQTGAKVRSTFYVTNRRKEVSLSVFVEDSETNDKKPLLKSVMLDNSSVPVVQLEVLPNLKAYTILVVRENGQYEVYNTDLTTRVRSGQFQGSKTGSRFVAAQAFSPTQAAKSVLKARPDLIAVSGADSTFMVGILIASHDNSTGGLQDLEIATWRLQGFNSNALIESNLTPILSWKISTSSPLLPREKNPATFGVRDTRLVIRTQSKMYVFDITAITPRRTQETPQTASDQSSSILVSDALTISSRPGLIQLYNTQFKTLLYTLDSSKTGTKRRINQVQGESMNLIFYFPSLKRIVATRRDQLVAIDLQVMTGEDFPTATKQVSLLVNNLGKGTKHQTPTKSAELAIESLVGRSDSYKDQLERWHDQERILDLLIQENKVAEFERMALNGLSSQRALNQSHISKNYRVDHIISKILRYESTSNEASEISSRTLKLLVPSQKLLGALAIKGYLSVERINRALSMNTNHNFEPVTHGVITQVLVDADESLGLLRKFLEEAPHVARQELCAVVQLLLRRALADSVSSTTLKITAVQTADSDTEKGQIPIESKGAIPINVSACLCASVERMADISDKALSKSMQDSFSQGEIIALVQFLRQQLFHSGYTRSLQAQLRSSLSSSEQSPPSVHKNLPDVSTEASLGAIASVLSSCMDAIGPVGSLSFGDEEEFVQTLIPDLSSEITRATEAVQESAFLSGLLRENLRYVESTTRSQSQNTLAKDGMNDKQHTSGTVITLYSESTAEGGFEQMDGALPLGLRNEGKISNSKIRKGNGRRLKRSEREMGMQQDRLRAPYALERLIL